MEGTDRQLTSVKECANHEAKQHGGDDKTQEVEGNEERVTVLKDSLMCNLMK